MSKTNKKTFQFLSVQIIEQVYSNATDIEEILWHREKYWKSQLFTTVHGMNSLIDLYSPKGNGFRTYVFLENKLVLVIFRVFLTS